MNIKIPFLPHRQQRLRLLERPDIFLLFWEIIALYCGTRMEKINTLCVQNAEFLIVTAGDTWSEHCASND